MVAVLTGTLGRVVFATQFPQETVLYRVPGLAAFVLLSRIWIATVFLSGMKQYIAIVWLSFPGIRRNGARRPRAARLRAGGAACRLRDRSDAAVHRHAALIVRDFPLPRFLSFEAFHKRLRYPALALIGLLLNLGVWIDKFVFWAWAPTSEAVIGPLRASIINDLPVFLAYLSIIPGMAVFLVRIETDFVEDFDGFYGTVRGGGSLQEIEWYRNGMVATVRTGLFEMMKIQAIAVLLRVVTIGFVALSRSCARPAHTTWMQQ